MIRINSTEKMLAVSMGFTLVLMAFRIVYSNSLNYIFYAWNLFLAVVPLLFSRKLFLYERIKGKAIFLLAGWLLFLPNAPYVITDLFHYKERWPVPKWYDLLLVTSAAWNGMMSGFISLRQVESFLSKQVNKKWVQVLISLVLILCGYGIYIGRYLRFNSWDIITDPLLLLTETSRHFLLPHEYLSVWKFTLLFAMMLGIIYYSLKQFSLNDGKGSLPAELK